MPNLFPCRTKDTSKVQNTGTIAVGVPIAIRIPPQRNHHSGSITNSYGSDELAIGFRRNYPADLPPRLDFIL